MPRALVAAVYTPCPASGGLGVLGIGDHPVPGRSSQLDPAPVRSCIHRDGRNAAFVASVRCPVPPFSSLSRASAALSRTLPTAASSGRATTLPLLPRRLLEASSGVSSKSSSSMPFRSMVRPGVELASVLRALQRTALARAPALSASLPIVGMTAVPIIPVFPNLHRLGSGFGKVGSDLHVPSVSTTRISDGTPDETRRN